MANKKQIAFVLLDLLRELTDEDHVLIAKDILKLLKERCGFAIERRTLYSNIRALEEAGYEIEKRNDNGFCYRLKGRPFSREEILLICRAVENAGHIPKRKAKAIAEKLLSTQSRYEAEKLVRDISQYRTQKQTATALVSEEEGMVVLFKCEKSVFEQLKDTLNKDAFFRERDGRYYISVKTSREFALFLAQKYLGSLMILEPPNLKNEFTERLQKATGEYLETM